MEFCRPARFGLDRLRLFSGDMLGFVALLWMGAALIAVALPAQAKAEVLDLSQMGNLQGLSAEQADGFLCGVGFALTTTATPY